MLRSKLASRAVTILTVFVLALSNAVAVYAAPSNDNLADATLITNLPYDVTVDTSGATAEPAELQPCGSGANPSSVWFAYTPSTTTTVTARVYYSFFPPVLAVYTGSSMNDLALVTCSQYYNNSTFQAQAGTTYYFQVSGYYDFYQGPIQFTLEVTPPPQVGINYSPGEPSIFDNVWFYASVSDPGGVYGDSYEWTLGDGATSDQSTFYHQFAADGDYPVSVTFTTFDGRSATANTLIQVRTRDIAITKFSIPQTARVNQTKVLNVEVTNKRYSGDVRVELYKGLPGGGETMIGAYTVFVPARANRPTTFKFSYTFTPDDGNVGKVTFRAVAYLVQGRDALPADNTAIGTTLVSR